MAAPHSYNSMSRQEVSGRIGSQSQNSASQPNLAGTLNRTKVERRPVNFIPARSRLDSDNQVLDGRSSPGRQSPGVSTLKRTAKSQDRLNSTSSSLGGSRGNLAQPQHRSRANGNDSRNNIPPQSRPQQPGSPNYSNLQNYTNNNNYDEKDIKVHRDDRAIRDERGSREDRNSINSISSHTNVVTSNRSSSSSMADNKFHEFEKVRLDYLRRGKLYEDTVFSPMDESVYFSSVPPYKMEWIRAKDIAAMYRETPMFFAHGIDRFDVRQGQLGDCWFVAAIACLSSPDHRNLFERVVPSGQSFQEGWYSGVFRFNFWHFGQWKQVLIDDYLPTNRGRLIFVNSPQANEFWAALMEKAYAKLYGSYEALKGGHLKDSLTDLTGGLTETYTLRGPDANVPGNIVNILFKALDRLSLIGCSIDGSGREEVLNNGLISSHAYSVTDLRRIMTGQQAVTLIRVRNPHGDGKEWRGRWSERSQDWQQIKPSDRSRLGLVLRDDGEFWMDFEDFKDNFDNLDICNLTPDAPIDVQRKWYVVEHHGRWIRGFNAGGRAYKEDSHWANPQYFLRLSDTDEDEDNVCSVVIQLMQKDRRKMKQRGETFLFIGFSVYQYEKGYAVPLKKDFFDYHREIADSGAFTNVRQVTKRLTLPPGEYVVVPCTWDPDEVADYYIRFFFEKGNVAEYCDDKPEKTDVPMPALTPEAKEAEENFKDFFYRASGENMEVDAFELRAAINTGLKNEPLHRDISLDACRTFVLLMDVDGSGRLSFYEFQFLWNYLRSWKKMFYQFDTNNSGEMNSRELRAAINGCGYKITNRAVASLVIRYADQNGRITLDNFLTLMARVMKTFNTFHDIQKDGSATLNLEQWVERTVIM